VQNVTVTLDNNWTINTLFPVVNFLKCIAFKTLTLQKVVQRHT